MDNISNYFNTPSSGILFDNSIEAAHKFNLGLQSEAAKHAFSQGLPAIEELRQRIASFSNANADEIALIPNTTYGLSALIPSLKKKSVMFYNLEYYGLTMSWKMHGYRTHVLKDEDGFHISVDRIKSELISENIEVLIISYVQWQTGFAIDYNELGKFCKAHDIIFILDIAQSFGALPFSFKDTTCDVALCPSYKWLNAGFGMGILWMKKEFFEKHPPTISGYGAFGPSFDPDNYVPNIRCYEPGHPNFTGIFIMNEALKMKASIGSEKIGLHNIELTQLFLQESSNAGLEPIGGVQRTLPSTIVVIKRNERIKSNIDKFNIDCTPRGEGYRFGFHFHNTKDAVIELVERLSQ